MRPFDRENINELREAVLPLLVDPSIFFEPEQSVVELMPQTSRHPQDSLWINASKTVFTTKESPRVQFIPVVDTIAQPLRLKRTLLHLGSGSEDIVESPEGGNEIWRLLKMKDKSTSQRRCLIELELINEQRAKVSGFIDFFFSFNFPAIATLGRSVSPSAMLKMSRWTIQGDDRSLDFSLLTEMPVSIGKGSSGESGSVSSMKTQSYRELVRKASLDRLYMNIPFSWNSFLTRCNLSNVASKNIVRVFFPRDMQSTPATIVFRVEFAESSDPWLGTLKSVHVNAVPIVAFDRSNPRQLPTMANNYFKKESKFVLPFPDKEKTISRLQSGVPIVILSFQDGETTSIPFRREPSAVAVEKWFDISVFDKEPAIIVHYPEVNEKKMPSFRLIQGFAMGREAQQNSASFLDPKPFDDIGEIQVRSLLPTYGRDFGVSDTGKDSRQKLLMLAGRYLGQQRPLLLQEEINDFVRDFHPDLELDRLPKSVFVLKDGRLQRAIGLRLRLPEGFPMSQFSKEVLMQQLQDQLSQRLGTGINVLLELS